MVEVSNTGKEKLLTDIVVLEVKRARLDNENEAAKQQLTASGNEINFLEEKNSELNCQLEEMNNVCHKLKFITNPTAHRKTMREKNKTTRQMIYVNSSTRYARRNETKDVLEYIHGGKEGAILGAWDFLPKYADSTELEAMILKYKKGKWFEKLCGHFSSQYNKTEDGLNQAVATNIICICRDENTHLCVKFKQQHLIRIQLRGRKRV